MLGARCAKPRGGTRAHRNETYSELCLANTHRIRQHSLNNKLKLTEGTGIIFNTSEVAVCCSSASSCSRVSCAIFLSLPSADKRGLCAAFGAFRALRSCGVAVLLFCRAVSLPPLG